MNTTTETVLLTDPEDPALLDQQTTLERVSPFEEMSNKDNDTDEERIGLLDQQQAEQKVAADAAPFDENPSMKRKSKTSGCIIVLVAAIVIITIASCLIAAAVITISLYSSADSSSDTSGNTISLDDILNSSFRIRSYSADWTNDGNILHFSESDGVQIHSPAENITETIISPTILEKYNVHSIKLSSSGDFALLVTNYKKVYRHSFLADYYVINIANTNLIWSLPLASGEEYTDQIQYATWSPNSAENKVAFVYNNNIYVYDISSNETTKHTDNGEDNTIYNGVPDWVYEEEVLSTDYALWWSPSGQYIAYITFNDTNVRTFQYPIYGKQMDNPYTHIESIAYPKAGTTNPSIKASVLSVVDGDIQELNPPPDNQYYIIYVVWANNTTPLISWMNRKQNNMTYCLYLPTTPSSCTIIYIQQSNAWIEAVQPPLFMNNGQLMILLDSVTVEDDSFMHIVQVDMINNQQQRMQLTDGKWETTQIIGTNSYNEIFYTSTKTNPWQRHIYYREQNNINKEEICLTCDQQKWIDNNVGSIEATECHYWSASCNDELTYCILYCSGPTLPFTVLVEYKDGNFTPVEYLEVNSELKSAISDIDLPTIEEVEIPADIDDDNDGSPLLYARVIFPPGATKECNKKHPMLFYVYGGPNSQMIGQYSVMSRLFPIYLSSSLDMIVISVDGRGTGYRGDKFKHAVYRKLGLLETADQIHAAKYFHELCYTDAKKTAIYGASYGGYMAGMVGSSGSRNSNVFSTAISQAPVTDWHYYDTIYTERYMGLPTEQDNEEGYEMSSLLNRAQNLSAVDYLLIHGTGDDNVHFQNSAQLVRTLTENDVSFTLQFYTDQAHALSGTPKHLYQLIEQFLQRSFENSRN